MYPTGRPHSRAIHEKYENQNEELYTLIEKKIQRL